MILNIWNKITTPLKTCAEYFDELNITFTEERSAVIKKKAQ